MTVQVGDKLKMDGEKQRYTVQACDDRFIIMTKPFNARKTYLYSIADLERKERGPCDVDSPTGASEALERLASGEMKVSHRNCMSLTVDEVRQMRDWRRVREYL